MGGLVFSVVLTVHVLAGLGVEFGLVSDRATCALQEQVSAFAAGKFGLGAEVTCHLIFLLDNCRIRNAGARRCKHGLAVGLV